MLLDSFDYICLSNKNKYILKQRKKHKKILAYHYISMNRSVLLIIKEIPKRVFYYHNFYCFFVQQ